MDPFEELGITEQNAEKHRRSATEKQVRKDVELLYLVVIKMFLWHILSRRCVWNNFKLLFSPLKIREV